MPPADGVRGHKQRLPPGRHGLPRAFVIENQRDRIIDALARTCAVGGYGVVTVEEIISAAGVSRRTFYDLFADKEQCFLVAYETVIERVLKVFDAAYRAAPCGWPERLSAALVALVQQFAIEPALARLTVVEVLGAGRAALQRRDASLRRFEVFFEPGAALLPLETAQRRLIARAVVGGLYEVLYARIAAGQTATLPDVAADLVYCALVPFLGHPKALAAREDVRARIPSGLEDIARGLPAT